ncbi:MAG: hypothetical protein ALECFALPRED_002396 [Alectoria fallacina]|uniref:Myb-like domain-containing protein n=1 Tax=Alectoria fallacina TaxID=1903189 RepID=A0A8H3IQC5_9LECA|nr:MAG: hypothetical protein ALECFALPRED_002396 [Alectoria fallacina]
MVKTKSPMSFPTQASSAQNDINGQVTHVGVPTNGASYDLLTGSYMEVGQSMTARNPYHWPTSAMDGASHEREDFASDRAAARVRRRNPVDEEPSSRAKMWDPVKDCSGPNSIQADLPMFLPVRHDGSGQLMDTTANVAPMGLHFCQGDHAYSQAKDYREHFTNSRTSTTASMSLFPYSQPHAMASAFNGNASMGSQPFQAGHPYDQFHHSRQHQSGFENVSILPQHLRDSSGQNQQQSLDSITRGAALIDIQPRQTGHIYSQSQDSGYQLADKESRMPALMASHELARPRPPSPIAPSNLSTQRKPDYREVNCLQRRNLSATMSQALTMAHYAETLDRQSNYTEAVRAYGQACALFREAIIRSCSLEERTECDNARNTYQARLDVLLRDSTAIQKNTPLDQNDQPKDDGPGRGKPQYSIIEDWALCHKDEEDLSWQEVAETPIFKGKRKHRSLSQRKHTIGKMGPQYHEAEKPWTEEEDRLLCALGDAGKTLGEIHRKFRSRNAERCLNRYFRLRGYHTTGKGLLRTSHQAREAPAL